ncbi:hypothetical protein VTH06DRAFT_6916 [Thermothelomyces fergusii]
MPPILLTAASSRDCYRPSRSDFVPRILHTGEMRHAAIATPKEYHPSGTLSMKRPYINLPLPFSACCRLGIPDITELPCLLIFVMCFVAPAEYRLHVMHYVPICLV